MVQFEEGHMVVLKDGEYDLAWYNENPELGGKVLTIREVYSDHGSEEYTDILYFVGFSDDVEDCLLAGDVRHATQAEIEAGHPIY